MVNSNNSDPFRNWAKAINNLLQTSRELSSAVASHGGVIGESREFFVRDILARFLPKSVTLGSGQIVDQNNKLSKQIDIIIARSEFPVLTSLALSDIYFADSVIATIEVKSVLKGGESETLWQALDNSRSVKQAELANPSLHGDDITAFWKRVRQSPSTYIFGYKGYKGNLAALKKSIGDWIDSRKPSLFELPSVVVTEGCVVITNYGISEAFDSNSLRNTIGHNCIFVAREDSEALTWLLVHLLGYVGGVHTGKQYHYARYAWGIEFARQAFREQDWQTWGKWEFNEVDKEVHFDLNESFDGVFPAAQPK